jgi:hypothetical protein
MLIITPESHLDHGLTPAHVAWLLERFKERNEFFIETLTMPADLPALDCALYGPTMGDEPIAEDRVHYVVRPGRKVATRALFAPLRKTHEISIIAGPDGPDACVLYTSYGGPVAPREPGDQSIALEPSKLPASLIEVHLFWSTHALTLAGAT